MRRTAAELAAALLVTPALVRLVPPDDPFRSTLLVLPTVVVALRAVARATGSPGGPARATLSGRLEAAALALLLLLTAGRDALGFLNTDALIAAGFVLLLTVRVGRAVVAARRLLGRRVPERPPAIFFALPLVVYVALLPWSSGHRSPDGDEPYYLLLTHSLAFDLDGDLADDYADEEWRRFLDRPLEPQVGDPRGRDGEIYSRHGTLLPLVLAPGYRLAGRWGALVTMAILAAALSWCTLRLAARYFPHHPRGRLMAWALLAFAPPLLCYSYQVWIEVPAALLVVWSLDRLHVLARRGRWVLADAWALLLPLGCLPLLKLRLGLVAIPLLVLALVRVPRPARALLGAASGAVGLAALLAAYNSWRYGNPLKMHSWGELEIVNRPPVDFLRGLFGVFYDSGFGLFPMAPLWALLLPALVLGLRRRSRWLTDLVLVASPYALILAPRLEWYGGWSPPFRYALVFLPLLAIGLAPLLDRRQGHGVRFLLGGLGSATLALAIVWTVVPGWTYRHADGRTHLLDAASHRLHADAARFFPSVVRPRAATVVWPLASLALVPIVLWRGRRRREAWAWGMASALAVTAAVPLAATRLPSRVVEAEDPYVEKDRGALYPALWTIARPRYRGGWMMVERGWIEAPLVAGGEMVSIRIDYRFQESYASEFELELAAGRRRLASWKPDRRDAWHSVELGPFRWPAGEPLVLRARDRPVVFPRNAIVIDRFVLSWR